MQYHYYRAYNVYNAIRCFVSAYVWMTGFGNFLYFDKKQDFSLERAVSMWLRINYFPILLSYFVGVPMDLLYIVPLHTTAFFITMVTCYLAFKLPASWSAETRNVVAIATCFAVHICFYETPLVHFLGLFSKEILFRFQSDKYSAVLGILSGYLWHFAQKFITWTHLPNEDGAYTDAQKQAALFQRIGGVGLIVLWWILFGHITDKYTYNPTHPYVFWMPVFGWLALRNGSKYLTEIHSTALEFFGKITLETYVLQFHVFMCNNVQNIPVVIPGSGKDGPAYLKFLNMLVTGVGFVALAYWARQITVTTQTTVTDLVVLLLRGPPPPTISSSSNEETIALTKLNAMETADNGNHNGDASASTQRTLHAKESGDV
jgi:N-acetylneuraminate 9-O-acetyltransferase